MVRNIVIVIFLILGAVKLSAQNVTVRAVGEPAHEVFRTIMEQTGKNFVYSSDLLKGINVSIDVHDQPLKKVLSEMFRDTDIDYKIKGNNVILKRRRKQSPSVGQQPGRSALRLSHAIDTIHLPEDVVVVSRLESPVVETAEIGAKKITADEVRNIPALFGESDVIKALQMQPGVTQATEGMASMNVHGGGADENSYMLDNVPLYQVNHFAGLFSAFNPDIIRYADFFKSSVPAKYDGRLSSFMDVRLRNGIPERHHGSVRLGLTAGTFNIEGPIGNSTSYLVGIRRSWYDLLTLPVLAIINSKNGDEKVNLQYYFMDFNARLNHRFSSRLNAFVSVYYGNDLLKSGYEDKDYGEISGWYEKDRYDLQWGNLLIQGGVNYRLNPSVTAEFTAAYTRYFTNMKYDDVTRDNTEDTEVDTRTVVKTDNHINDWIFRSDFDWLPSDNSRVRFGAYYIRHLFQPGKTSRSYTFSDTQVATRDSTSVYGANEINAYIEDDIRLSDHFRANGGVHLSMFHIERKFNGGISPRLSVSWNQNEDMAFKTAYSRTVQYVHQLTQSYLALPTDRWIPITGKFKPQTADKVSIGGYRQFRKGEYVISLEGYWKWMHNLVEYRDEYYLKPPMEMWNERLTSGRGSAKGVDFKIEKTSGKFTGHISYSLAWADRKFRYKNFGKTYPARFDNRHTINIVVNWKPNSRVQVNVAWVGHSGNRFTLLPQMWESPDFGAGYEVEEPLRCRVNNYQLPFYHRLDLSCVVNNRRGYWTFGLYNAYCHLNTIAIRRGYKDEMEKTEWGVVQTSRPVFEKVKLLPIIPSISYTWQF